MPNIVTVLRSWFSPQPAWEDNPYIRVKKGGGISVDAEKYFADEKVQEEIDTFFREITPDEETPEGKPGAGP